MISPGSPPNLVVFSRHPRSMKHEDNPRICLANVKPIVTAYSWEKNIEASQLNYRDKADGAVQFEQFTYNHIFRLSVCKRFNVPVTTLSSPGSPLDGSNSYVYPDVNQWAVFSLPSAIPAASFVGGRKRWRIVRMNVQKTSKAGVYEMRVDMEAQTIRQKMDRLASALNWPDITDPIVKEIETDPEYA